MVNPTQASWERALGVFDSRLARLPPDRDTKLRHRKEAVVAAYSDFTAKLPDAKLPSLAIRALWEDGSKWKSNMTASRIWQLYGIQLIRE